MICRTILWSHHATTGKNREIQLKQQTIRCQVLDSLNKIWSRLISINLYLKNVEISVCCGFYNPRNQTETSCRANHADPLFWKMNPTYLTQVDPNFWHSGPTQTQLDPSFDPDCLTWPVNWINIKQKFGLYKFKMKWLYNYFYGFVIKFRPKNMSIKSTLGPLVRKGDFTWLNPHMICNKSRILPDPVLW